MVLMVMVMKLIFKFILIFMFGSLQVVATEKEEEYKRIERIITEGKIIHKKTMRWFMDYEDVTPNARDGKPDTSDDLMERYYTLRFLISFKKKLYDCTYSERDNYGFNIKDSWSCVHIFEPNKK